MPSFKFRSFATAAFALAACATAQQPSHVVDHHKIGGNSGWDYLLSDPAAHLFYLPRNKDEIVNTPTGKPAGAITGLKGQAVSNRNGKAAYKSRALLHRRIKRLSRMPPVRASAGNTPPV